MYYIQNRGRITLKSNHSDLLSFDWKTFDNADSCDGICSRHLISIMTSSSPSQRPSISCLLFHPFFWSNEKILEFFIGISNRLELRDSLSQRARSLFQEGSRDVIGGNWIDQLDSAVRESLPHRNRMQYDGSSVENLIRALRNKKNHFDDMIPSAKWIFGAIPDGYTEYWTGRFPKLLLHIFLKFYRSGLSREDNFAQFYPKIETCTEICE